MTKTLTTNIQKANLDDLYSRLNEVVKIGVAAIKEGCAILAELKRRGESHPLMFNGIFKWYEAVCDGSINPELIVKFLGDEKIISKVIDLPVNLQTEIVETGMVKVVETVKGEIVETDKPLIRMSPKQLDQVFDGGRIRSFDQQLKIVKASAPKPQEPIPLVQASPNGEYLIIGGSYTVEPSALIEPLRALGFTIMKRQ